MHMYDYSNFLNCNFRTDRYSIARNNREGDFESVEQFEYFLVCGDNTFIRVYDIENARFLIYSFDKYIPIDYSGSYLDLDEVFDLVNTFQRSMMFYDYAVTELRKMSDEEAVKSDLYELKRMVEDELWIMKAMDFARITFGIEGDDDEDDGTIEEAFLDVIPKDKQKEIEKHCKFLTYAYDLFWRGVISSKTLRKFDNFDDLDRYIAQNKLLENGGEGVDQRIHQLCVGQFGKGKDIIGDFRKPENELFKERLQRFRPSKTQKRIYKPIEDEAWKIYDKKKELVQDLDENGEFMDKKERAYLKRRLKNVSTSFDKKISKIAFLPDERQL